MMKIFATIIALFCIAVLSSCQKDETTAPEPPIDSIPENQSYLPLTQGTFWVYKDSATAVTDTATVLNDELIQDSITFKKVQLGNTSGIGFSYYGVLGHNYYLRGEQMGISVTLQVLNDSLAAGSSWTNDMGTISGVPVRGKGTIIEKDITYTVQGTTYQNVIHSQYVLSYKFLGTYLNFATYDFYFAKGIGIVKMQSSIADNTGSISKVSSEDLIGYTIK